MLRATRKIDERQLRTQIVLAKRAVIKVGSQVLCQADGQLDQSVFANLCANIAVLLRQGREVVLVSSGAVATGTGALAQRKLKNQIGKQALAAIGQPLLMAHYRQLFAGHEIEVAQVLLTHADLADRGRFLHARRVIAELAGAGILTIVNENDTVAVEELKFGDNDALAAQVAHLTSSDVLVLLTEVAGLYTADPQKDPGARLISGVHGHDDATLALAGDSKTAFGTGGMRSKVAAARRAGDVGAVAVIASGKQPDVLAAIFGGQAVGTVFAPGRKKLTGKRSWIATSVRTKGILTVDDGAAAALRSGGRSLLPIGVVQVEGIFAVGDAVLVVDRQGKPLGHGLVRYDSHDARHVAGWRTDKIASELGALPAAELIHRDDFAPFH